MAQAPICPRCGAEGHGGDEICRRCGGDLPPSARRPTAPVVPPSRRFHLAWMLGGVLGYTMLLFLGFQLTADSVREHAAVLGQIKTEADVMQHREALEALAWRVFALVGVCYATGGILLGRFAPGRPVIQATLAAAISWGGLALRAASLTAALSAPVLLPLLVGGAIVTVIALGASAFGAWLRPRDR